MTSSFYCFMIGFTLLQRKLQLHCFEENLSLLVPDLAIQLNRGWIFKCKTAFLLMSFTKYSSMCPSVFSVHRG